MGILRTNEISGLETPTPVTGSVVFDGDGDYLDIGAFHISDSWTMEFWFNTSVNNTIQRPMNFSSNLGGTNYAYIELTSGGKIKARVASAAAFGETPAVTTNEWHHTALSYDGSTAYFVYDGKLIATQSVSYSNNSIQVRFGADESNASSNLFTGYVSNARILSGIALYTTDYTVPVHKLEKIDGTVLLCCNNPDSAGAEETGKTITVNGDAAASTFSPGLTRDFTFGTQFRGVAKFDTQGYFVPPSGTTEQRGRGRGVFMGGYTTSPSNSAVSDIHYIEIQSTGNSFDFGDLANAARWAGGASSSSTRAIYGGGSTPGNQTHMDYITISTTSDAIDYADLSIGRGYTKSCSNAIRGVWAGGRTGSPSVSTNTIEYVNIATTGGTGTDYGDLSTAGGRTGLHALSSSTRAVFAGGYTIPSGSTINVIDYISILSGGTAVSFGNLSVSVTKYGDSCSNGVRGIFAGGTTPTNTNSIQYVTIASTGNSQDFGDLTQIREHISGTSNSIRGIFAGGVTPTYQNTIDYVTISSTGNAQDFGDVSRVNLAYTGATSDSHGGLG